MARISPQKRYARAVKRIERVTGSTWRSSQRVYRELRQVRDEPLTSRDIGRYAESELKRIVETERFEKPRRVGEVIFEGTEAAFDIKDNQQTVIEARLPDRPFDIIVNFDIYKEGIFKERKRLRRTGLDSSAEFWSAYWDATKRALEPDSDVAIFTKSVTAV